MLALGVRPGQKIAQMLVHAWLFAIALVLAAGGTVSLPSQLSAAALALITTFSLIHGLRPAAATALLFLCVVLVGAVPGLGTWPLPGAVGLLRYLAARQRWPAWLEARWLTRGRIDRAVLGWLLGAVLLAGVALVGWYLITDPDVADIRATFLPDYPWWLLVLGGVGFSCVNAAVEEALFRGVLQDTLTSLVRLPVIGLVGQAIAFGLLHLHGFPRGWLGVGLATIYGLMMGLLRQRSGGMLAPWLAHILTDLVIVGILLSLP